MMSVYEEVKHSACRPGCVLCGLFELQLHREIGDKLGDLYSPVQINDINSKSCCLRSGSVLV